ncbi:MAG TPA: cytochrome bd-I oxidase subunit CydX [Steroidobacteraceae bacterium]|jgi:cyd operon protein YbgT|nr:cytochrome bd-I oxidase subunit CydX [Steroidobacteraceae bacterium]
MWYFTWILGLAFACCFGILNAMWLEVQEQQDTLTQDKQFIDDNQL